MVEGARDFETCGQLSPVAGAHLVDRLKLAILASFGNPGGLRPNWPAAFQVRQDDEP